MQYKDFQATEETTSPSKRTSSALKHEIILTFFFLMDNFLLP
jgi:hypothetical protein